MQTSHATAAPVRPLSTGPSIDLPAGIPEGGESILTVDAIAFLADLHRRFAPRVKALLAARSEAQARYDRGERPTVLDDPRARPVLEQLELRALASLADRVRKNTPASAGARRRSRTKAPSSREWSLR